MTINIKLPDDFFAEGERDRLKELFEVTDDREFLEALGKVVGAALSEYTEMFLGRGLPARADEIAQQRLFCLIKNYFGQRLPSEWEVASMFQLSLRRSRNLIRSVMIRFRSELEQEIHNTLEETIGRCKLGPKDRRYRVVIQSHNVLQELNGIIDTVAPGFDSVGKVRFMARTYSMSKDSYQALVRHLLREAIELAQFDEHSKEHHVVIQADNIVGELEEIMKAARLKHPVKKLREMPRTFAIPAACCNGINGYLTSYWKKLASG